jgi:hypothetical protein
MTLQAQWLGMFSRQFRAFKREGLAAEFEVPEHWEVTTLSAFGRTPPTPGEEPLHGPVGMPDRQRRALDEIVWPVA